MTNFSKAITETLPLKKPKNLETNPKHGMSLKKVFKSKDFLYTDHYKNYFFWMENDKYFSLGDSYIDINEKEVVEFIDDILDGKLKTEITTKSLPKTPVKLP